MTDVTNYCPLCVELQKQLAERDARWEKLKAKFNEIAEDARKTFRESDGCWDIQHVFWNFERALAILRQLETEGGESEPIREGATSYGWSSGFVTDRDREGPPDPRVPYPKINTDIRVSVPCKHCGGENYFTLTNRGEE